ncbi:MAG: hypothetical protein H0V32_07510, partial [Nocardioidaceae bacterium]|nr:hypothetical protein [Nocardioidaceae bacterium]
MPSRSQPFTGVVAAALPEGPLVSGPAAAAVAPRGVVKAARTDRPVLVRGAAVVAVPANEGLWIEARGEQVWVQLRAPGESPVQVRRGMRLDVQATAVQHGTGFARSVGLDAAAAARRLDRRGVHLQADRATSRFADWEGHTQRCPQGAADGPMMRPWHSPRQDRRRDVDDRARSFRRANRPDSRRLGVAARLGRRPG